MHIPSELKYFIQKSKNQCEPIQKQLQHKKKTRQHGFILLYGVESPSRFLICKKSIYIYAILAKH